MAGGTVSSIIKCVIKKPYVTSLVVNGETKTNQHDVTLSFEKEILLLRTIAPHDHIVNFFGVLPSNEIVIEYVSDKNLYTIFDDNIIISDSTKIKWFGQILSAIVHIHHHEFAHGDISPGNILITDDDDVKLCDFGRSTTKNQRIYPSTHPFMSPELMNNKTVDGKRCDSYALGILLVCLEMNKEIVLSYDDVSEGKRPSELSDIKLFKHVIHGYLADESNRVLPSMDQLILVEERM